MHDQTACVFLSLTESYLKKIMLKSAGWQSGRQVRGVSGPSDPCGGSEKPINFIRSPGLCPTSTVVALDSRLANFVYQPFLEAAVDWPWFSGFPISNDSSVSHQCRLEGCTITLKQLGRYRQPPRCQHWPNGSTSPVASVSPDFLIFLYFFVFFFSLDTCFFAGG